MAGEDEGVSTKDQKTNNTKHGGGGANKFFHNDPATQQEKKGNQSPPHNTTLQSEKRRTYDAQAHTNGEKLGDKKYTSAQADREGEQVTINGNRNHAQAIPNRCGEEQSEHTPKRIDFGGSGATHDQSRSRSTSMGHTASYLESDHSGVSKRTGQDGRNVGGRGGFRTIYNILKGIVEEKMGEINSPNILASLDDSKEGTGRNDFRRGCKNQQTPPRTGHDPANNSVRPTNASRDVSACPQRFRSTITPAHCHRADVRNCPTDIRHPSAPQIRFDGDQWESGNHGEKGQSDTNYRPLHDLPLDGVILGTDSARIPAQQRRIPVLQLQLDQRKGDIGESSSACIAKNGPTAGTAINTTRSRSQHGPDECGRDHNHDVHKAQLRKNAQQVHGQRGGGYEQGTYAGCDYGKHGILMEEHITNKWRVKTVEMSAEERLWPLHTKNVEQLKIEQLRAILPQHLLEKFDLNYILYSEKTPLVQHTFSLEHTVDLSADDIAQLLDNNLIEPTVLSEVKGVVNTFTRAERRKSRRRWIVWCLQQNECFPVEEEQRVSLKSVNEMFENSQRFSKAVCIDMKAFYHQFTMSVVARQYHCFRTSQGWFRLKTVPTGGRHPPMIAEITMQGLCWPPREETCTDTFIDNIRIGGTDDALTMAHVADIYNKARSVGISINEGFTSLAPKTCYDFLGVSYRHEEGHTSARCMQHTIDATIAAWNSVTETSTLRDILSLFGRLNWASMVLNIQLCSYYYAFKFLRRRVGSALDSLAHLWPSSESHWERWVETVRRNEWRTTVRAEAVSDVFTDASGTGYGAIAFRSDSTVVICAGRWTETESRKHINVLEAVAARKALELLDTDDAVRLWVDNTSVLFAIRKTRSRSFLLNNELRKIFNRGKRILSVQYVHTSENPADVWSRI